MTWVIDFLHMNQEEIDRSGVIYMSRVPPQMNPFKVKSLLSAYGEIDRIFLKKKGNPIESTFIESLDHLKKSQQSKSFGEGIL